MIRTLLESGIAKQYWEIVADMDSHFQVVCHNELSKEFPLSVGAKTGCPLSALLFVVSLDKSLKEYVCMLNLPQIKIFTMVKNIIYKIDTITIYITNPIKTI